MLWARRRVSNRMNAASSVADDVLHKSTEVLVQKVRRFTYRYDQSSTH